MISEEPSSDFELFGDLTNIPYHEDLNSVAQAFFVQNRKTEPENPSAGLLVHMRSSSVMVYEHA